MRSFPLITILALLPGCALLTEPPPVKSGEDLDTAAPSEDSGDTTTETDSGDTAEDTGTDDTATETEAILTVDFTTTWSASVPFQGTIGEEVNLGALILDSLTDETITVDTLVPSLWIDTDGDGVYRLGAENGIEARNFVSQCRLTEVTSYHVYAGPQDPGSTDGAITFTDDFTVGGEYTTALNVRCTLVGTVPEGETYGIAVDVHHSGSQQVIATVDGGESLIPVQLGNENGAQDGLELRPDVAVLITD